VLGARQGGYGVPGELYGWRVLVSAGWPIEGGRYCKDRFGQNLTFSLVLTAARVPIRLTGCKLFHLSFGEPAIMSTFALAVKPCFLPPKAAMVRFSASLWGACTHLGRGLSQRCNHLV